MNAEVQAIGGAIIISNVGLFDEGGDVTIEITSDGIVLNGVVRINGSAFAFSGPRSVPITETDKAE